MTVIYIEEGFGVNHCAVTFTGTEDSAGILSDRTQKGNGKWNLCTEYLILSVSFGRGPKAKLRTAAQQPRL
jgi:hypothetical protein